MARFTKDDTLLILTTRMTLAECTIRDELFSFDDDENEINDTRSTISSTKEPLLKELKDDRFNDAVEDVKDYKLDIKSKTAWLDFSQQLDDFVIIEKDQSFKLIRKMVRRSRVHSDILFDFNKLKDEGKVVRCRTFIDDCVLLET